MSFVSSKIGSSPVLWTIFFAVVSCASIPLFGSGGFAVIFASIAFLSIVYPAAALALAAFFFPLDKPGNLSGSFTVYSGEFILVLILSGALINIMLGRIKPDRTYYGISPVILLLLFSLVPLGWVPDKTALIKSVVKNSELFIYFFAALCLVNSKNDFRLIALFLVSGFLLTTAISFNSLFNDRTSLINVCMQGINIPRPDGGMGPTTYAGYLNFLLPFSLLCFFIPGPVPQKIYAFAAASFILASQIAFPFSRNGWLVLALILICSLCYMFISGMKNGVLSLSAIVLTGVVISYVLLVSLITGLGFKALTIRTGDTFQSGTGTNFTTLSRMEFYKMGLRIAVKNPAGVGPGNYRPAVLKYSKDSMIDPAYVHHMHNTYLHVLVTCGWGGLAALLLIFIYYFAAMFHFYPVLEREAGVMVIFTSISIFAFMAGITLDLYTVFGRGVIFGLMPGALLGAITSRSKQ
ncbi:MAG: O-antigen ligase family protein [Spirochaetia bacterium]|nr:O-antigen ligase family protein [Spirochaetia bacterium]